MKKIIKLSCAMLMIISFVSPVLRAERAYLAITLKSSSFDGVKKFIKRTFKNKFGLNFTKKKKQHITLVFFDDLPKSKLDKAKMIIESVIEMIVKNKDLKLKIPAQGSVAFFGHDNTYVVYKLEQNRMLEDLVKAFKFYFDGSEIAYNKKNPFSAHVTIGTVDSSPSYSVRNSNILDTIAPPCKYKKTFEVEEIKLFMSKKRNGKQRYGEVETFRLSKGGWFNF